MPKGELFINGKDAYTSWGISFDQTALSTLMTPAPCKEFIQNKSRLEHGKRVIVNDPKKDERNVTLSFNLTANSEDEFMSRYSSFCDELATGQLLIRTKYQDAVYKMIYESCTQFSQLRRSIAKFSLKLTEPNPNDRS